MSGLAEILEENARLRRELQDKETELARRDAWRCGPACGATRWSRS